MAQEEGKGKGRGNTSHHRRYKLTNGKGEKNPDPNHGRSQKTIPIIVELN